MKALFCHDHHYYKNGDVTLSKGQYHHDVWQRYLDHFNHITVIGRDGGHYTGNTESLNVASRAHVTFDLLSDTNSLSGLLFHRQKIRENIRLLVADHDVIIMRGISEIGSMAYHEAKRQGKTIAIEMIACPWDELWYHGTINAKLYAPYRYIKARRMARNCDAILYVSQHVLQYRYPSNAHIQAAASNVQIDAKNARPYHQSSASNAPFQIGLIGTLKNKLKGVHIAIQAASILKKRGIDDFAMRILGPGNPSDQPCNFAALADRLNVNNHIIFDGLRPSGQPVLDWLQGLDLYIQPSFQEGVPRATIESMSQGLPVIGSTAGGIPELLESECIIPRGNAKALADKVEWMMKHPNIRQRHGKRNHDYALNFTMDRLAPIRYAFWDQVRSTIQSQSG